MAPAPGRVWSTRWPMLVAFAVSGHAFAWSWSSRLQSLGNLVFWLSVSLIAAGLVARSYRSPVARRWLLVVTGLGGVLALTALWSVAPADTFEEAVKFGAVLVVAATVGAELESEGAARDQLARALAWLAPGALALTAAVVAVGLVSPSSVAGPGASGLFNGPNVLSIFLALTLPFALVQPRIAERPVALLGLVGGAAVVAALSGGRTGFGALLLAVCALALGRRRLVALAAALAICVAAAGLAAALAWTPPTLGEHILASPEQAARVTAQGGRRQSVVSELVGGRSEAWAESVRLLDERPAQGHGFGTGATLFDRYGSRERFTYFVGAFAAGTNPHNAYLQVLLELGIPGGLLFLAPFLAGVALAVRFLTRGDVDASTLALCATVVAAAAAALFESTLGQLGSLTLLSWIAGAAVVAVWLRDQGRGQGPGLDSLR